MKINNIRPLGRFKNNLTGQIYNVKKGNKVGYGTDIYFYLYRNSRIIIPAQEFFKNHTKTS